MHQKVLRNPQNSRTHSPPISVENSRRQAKKSAKIAHPFQSPFQTQKQTIFSLLNLKLRHLNSAVQETKNEGFINGSGRSDFDGSRSHEPSSNSGDGSELAVSTDAGNAGLHCSRALRKGLGELPQPLLLRRKRLCGYLCGRHAQHVRLSVFQSDLPRPQLQRSPKAAHLPPSNTGNLLRLLGNEHGQLRQVQDSLVDVGVCQLQPPRSVRPALQGHARNDTVQGLGRHVLCDACAEYLQHWICL
jgi:hypothetical protein